jgi:hypothetical protein
MVSMFGKKQIRKTVIKDAIAQPALCSLVADGHAFPSVIQEIRFYHRFTGCVCVLCRLFCSNLFPAT